MLKISSMLTTACFIAFTSIVCGHIYGDYDPIELTQTAQQVIVGVLTILLFICMAMELTGPEVLFLIALMIVTLAQILTISDALSGEQILP